MFMLHSSGKMLSPTGRYINLENVKPSTKLLNGNGKHVYVKTIKRMPTGNELVSMNVQQWHSPFVCPDKQQVLTTHGWKPCIELKPNNHMTVFPCRTNWEIPRYLQIKQSNTIVTSSFSLGYAIGAAYLCFDHESQVLRIGNDHKLSIIVEHLTKAFGKDFQHCKNKNTVNVDEELASLFNVLHKDEPLPTLLKCVDPEYAYGMYRGIVDVSTSMQDTTVQAFETAFIMMLLSRKFVECNVHVQRNDAIFNVTPPLPFHGTACMYLVELTNASETSLICNNVIVRAL